VNEETDRLRILFLTSIDHPQVRYEAEYLGEKLELTYIVAPTLEKKQITYSLRCLFKKFPLICVSLLKLSVPPLPQILTYVLICSIILEKEKLENKKYDLIYAHWLFPAGFVGLILSRILKCKLVSAVWGYDVQVAPGLKDYGVQGLKRVISRYVIEKSDLIIVRKRLHEQLARHLSKPEAHDKIIFVPPAIRDISRNTLEGLTDELKGRLGLDYDDLSRNKIVLYSPSLRPLYGIMDFIRAVPIVKRSIKDCIFIIVGEGELKKEVVKFVRENKLEDRVILLGRLSHESIRALYKLSALVCDLAYPGTATTTMEALCFGKPVIGIYAADTHILHGINGFLIKKGDYEGLARYMIAVLGDGSLRNELSIRARKMFDEKFNIERGTNTILEVLKGLGYRMPSESRR